MPIRGWHGRRRGGGGIAVILGGLKLVGHIGERSELGLDLFFADREVWRIAAAGGVDQRAAFFQYAYSSAPAMVMRTIDAGSKYPCTGEDADGDTLDGGNHYRLHLPPNPPATIPTV